jgi:hypothetical protein
MKILSDEDAIWDELMARLSDLGSEYGSTFVSWHRRYRNRRIGDNEVPEICRREGEAALLTLNYKDFGRHQVYYQALLSAGVSSIVLRQPNRHTYTPDVDYQVELVRPHLRNIVRQLERTDEPLSFKINRSGIRINRLQDLITRFPT